MDVNANEPVPMVLVTQEADLVSDRAEAEPEPEPAPPPPDNVGEEEEEEEVEHTEMHLSTLPEPNISLSDEGKQKSL